MKLALTAAQAAFRAEVQDFLRPWLGLNRYLVSDDEPDLRDFLAAMAARNWLALAWPAEVGGLGRGPMEEFILWNEIAYHRVARCPHAVGIVAKTIIRYGTPAQQQRWLTAIRTLEASFALTYSEPQAGSDLAGLLCRAERDGADYVITGNKCWNSRAHRTTHLWLLCRTGPPGSRGRGLSLIIVPTGATGLAIAPVQVMDGNFFTQIHFDAVRVPAENRIGPENGAWGMMAAALAEERHVQFLYGRVRRDYDDLVAFCRAQGMAADPVVRERLADLALDVLESDMQCLRVLHSVLHGEAAGPEAAANKLVHTEAVQRIARTAFEFGCPAALSEDTTLPTLWRQSMIETIGGGTTQVMKGIYARQRLQLGGK